MSAPSLESQRVLLRQWKDSDLIPWVSMNADPETLVFFPRTSTPEESTNGFAYVRNFLLENNYGLWEAEEKSSGEFMGFVGITWLELPTLAYPKCREIGWRLAKRYWGKGYATEAAKVVLEYARHSINITELYSVTAELNLPSINVMKKIGLRERPELGFLHPRVADDSPLKPHVVYSM